LLVQVVAEALAVTSKTAVTQETAVAAVVVVLLCS
jgi:hypothetical protein